MSKNKIKIRVRLIIIKKGKILMTYTKDEGYYFYIGGAMEYGETLEQTCQREIKEECGGAEFKLRKILYVRDFIVPKINEHSLELYILGDIDRFEEIEGIIDGELGKHQWQTWIELRKLKNTNVKPKDLTKRLLHDYQKGFPNKAIYLGEID
jgi:ADP-ribose pyrophosphatase YjhB (NUDIX family)